MPIIKKSINEAIKLKGINLNKHLFDEVKKYCDHFEVSLDDFINQAAWFVLSKDKDWKKIKSKKESE